MGRFLSYWQIMCAVPKENFGASTLGGSGCGGISGAGTSSSWRGTKSGSAAGALGLAFFDIT
jgi:hypothetical protein